MKYDKVSLGDLHTDFEARPVDGKNPGWIVTGVCPKCRAKLETPYKLTYLAATMNALEEDDPRRFHTMACDCGMPHEDRDDKTSPPGCGAYWKIRL